MIHNIEIFIEVKISCTNILFQMFNPEAQKEVRLHMYMLLILLLPVKCQPSHDQSPFESVRRRKCYMLGLLRESIFIRRDIRGKNSASNQHHATNAYIQPHRTKAFQLTMTAICIVGLSRDQDQC